MALSSQHRHLLKWLLIAGLVAMLETVATSFNLPMLLQNLLLWVQSLGAWGVIVFIVIYGLATILLIPGSLLTLGGGALFGVVWGSIYVFIAALLGSTCAFLIGRYLARDRVLRRIEGNPKFRAISAAVAQEGLKIVFLARLSPIFPFNLLNYAFSVTQVSLKDFVLGSVGMIPATVLYVYIGSLAGDLAKVGMPGQAMSSQAEIAQWILRLVGLLATIAVTVYVTRIAKKALNQSVSPGESSHVPLNH